MTSERYSRQTLFKEIGYEGQQKISQNMYSLLVWER